MIKLEELIAYTNDLLDIGAFTDYAPNGLQVEGRAEVRKLVSGVTASLALVEAAADVGADALLVHHGYFWKGEDPCITGMKRGRIQHLLSSGLSLLAYHLPLDAHDDYGNNVQLAKVLGFDINGRFGPSASDQLALHGALPAAMNADELLAHISQRLGRCPLHLPGAQSTIKTIGWCSGAAQGYFEQAAALGLDAFITGEVSEQTTHIASEMGVHFFAAGHHATERFGVLSLGEHLAARFGLAHEHINIDNPV